MHASLHGKGNAGQVDSVELVAIVSAPNMTHALASCNSTSSLVGCYASVKLVPRPKSVTVVGRLHHHYV